MAKRKESDTDSLALSRSALEDFIRCPRCFYLQRRKGLKPLARIPLTLAVATDALLKNEFDAIRGTDLTHPIWTREGLRVRAFQHSDIEMWRSNRKGIRVEHKTTGVTVYGAVDDIWQNLESGDLHVVDYKSTSKQDTPTLDGGFGDSYKRQMDIYQWLFREAGFPVSNTGYFLYVNGSKIGRFYDGDIGRMLFDTTLISYQGNTAWVSECVTRAVECFQGERVPDSNPDCDTCRYIAERSAIA
jgi:hypothetical protein